MLGKFECGLLILKFGSQKVERADFVTDFDELSSSRALGFPIECVTEQLQCAVTLSCCQELRLSLARTDKAVD